MIGEKEKIGDFRIFQENHYYQRRRTGTLPAELS
jgi:hypothetical protein